MVSPADIFIGFSTDLLASFALYLIISTSLNLEFGYAGLPNFGKMLSVAAGAFVAGGISGRIAAYALQIDPSLDFIAQNVQVMTTVQSRLATNPLFSIGLMVATLSAAGLIGGLVGFVSSYPAIRLREDYLAITLLAMAEAIRVIGYNYTPIIGGTLGVIVADVYRWIPGSRFANASLIMLGIAGAIFLYAHRLTKSPAGRAMKAVRDNELAAGSLGKRVVRVRTNALIIASGMAAVAGALDAFRSLSAFALTYDRSSWTFVPWVMVILGGAGNMLGGLIGSFSFVTLRKLIELYKHDLGVFLPFNPVWLDQMLLGLLLIVILMFRPHGILPEKPTLTLKRNKLRRIILGDSGPSCEEGMSPLRKQKSPQ